MKQFYLEFGGNTYYLDFDSIDEFLFTSGDNKKVIDTEIIIKKDDKGEICNTEEITKESINEKEINGVRYEIISGMIETVLNSNSGEDDDDLLGAKRALNGTSMSYKLAFNTLIKYNILKEIK